MSHETPDTPMETHRTEPAVGHQTLPEQERTVDRLAARLRVFRYLRPTQLAVLLLLVAVVAFVALAPAALTGFLGLFVATVALLVVAPYVVVRLATDGGR